MRTLERLGRCEQHHLPGSDNKNHKHGGGGGDPRVEGSVPIEFEHHYEPGEAGLALGDCDVALRVLGPDHPGMRLRPRAAVVEHHRLLVSADRPPAVPVAVDRPVQPCLEGVHVGGVIVYAGHCRV